MLKTAHSEIPTPVFMPVGTLGTVKALDPTDLTTHLQPEIILSNTYHLFLRPGMEVMENAGGAHPFMHWEKSLLTDSGGYQVFSLAGTRKIKEEGVKFASHIDGAPIFFSPENVIEIQRSIGADIIMAFDECPPYPCEEKYARKSMDLTHRWLDRCIAALNNTKEKYGHSQFLFPIVQGSVFPELRKKSAEYIAAANLPGCAIGGLSVGEPHEDLYAMTSLVCEILPADKPRYLMGVGTPENLLECVARGIDMFDCVLPSRNARHGILYTRECIINIKNQKWKNDFSLLDPNHPEGHPARVSKAYLRHLFSAGEISSARIATLHNISFYLELMKECRQHILNGSFETWKNELLPQLSRRR
jgi:queuine tRNA-ribosyltransferase